MLDELRAAFDRALGDRLAAYADRFPAPDGVPGLGAVLGDYVREGGKRLRPLLFLCAHRGYAPRGAPDPLPAAVGLELLHTFALIHDDLADNTPERRGAPSLHVRLAQALAEGAARPWADLARGTKERARTVPHPNPLSRREERCLTPTLSQRERESPPLPPGGGEGEGEVDAAAKGGSVRETNESARPGPHPYPLPKGEEEGPALASPVPRGETRRAYERQGRALAMLAGDLLHAGAMEAFAQTEAAPERVRASLELLTRLAMHTAGGAYLEVATRAAPRGDPDPRAALRLYDNKTGRYTFVAPLCTAAVLAGAPARERRRLAAWGRALGRVYQIRDDLRDLHAYAQARPAADAPLREETALMLPVVWAASRAGRRVRARLAGFYQAPEDTPPARRALVELLRECGALAAARDEAARIHRRAAQVAERLGMRASARRAMDRMLDAYLGPVACGGEGQGGVDAPAVEAAASTASRQEAAP